LLLKRQGFSAAMAVPVIRSSSPKGPYSYRAVSVPLVPNNATTLPLPSGAA
jgi:hypothetical protein